MMRLDWLKIAILAGAAVSGSWVTARAMEGTVPSYAMSGWRQDTSARTPTELDEEDDRFFSGGVRGGVAIQAPGSLGGAPAAVDVGAVCRAVLADNPYRYNSAFVQGCRIAVLSNGQRRLTR